MQIEKNRIDGLQLGEIKWIKYQDDWVILIYKEEIAEALKSRRFQVIPLGIDPKDKKNINSKRSPYLLGPFLSRYISRG